MKRIIKFIGISLISFSLLCGCGSGLEIPEPLIENIISSQKNEPDHTSFKYEHDPRDNAEAMKDIIDNSDAVYGFSPSPESKRLGEYAEYDWTDPEFVADAREKRIEYHKSLDSMTDILYKMKEEGATTEEMARAVSTEKNRIRLESYKDDPEGLEKLKQSNMDTYGHEDGPTPDEMFEKYGSWEIVMQKAFSTNMGMDACCGLYDEYYQLYIELGYINEYSKQGYSL